MIMTKHIAPELTLTLAALAALSTLSGCAATATPNVDAHFGEAVLAARALQTINPDAARNPDPVNGIDGRAARDAMGRYHDSFKTPPPSFNVINIGGSISGGG
jgi:hypothetical protein